MSRKLSLDATAREQIEAAHRTDARRAAATVVGGHANVMRQTVVGLVAGARMDEHENPGEATVYVIKGRVQLEADGQSWEGRTGDLIEVPQMRHAVRALEDSAILLTAVPIPR